MAKQPTPPRAAFVMAEPNEDLFTNCGSLRDVRCPNKNHRGEVVGGLPIVNSLFGPLGNRFHWLDAGLLEHFVATDAEFQKMLAVAASRGFPEKSVKALENAFRQLFEEQYLDHVKTMFDIYAKLLADYFIAKHAHAAAFPNGNDE